MACGKRLGFTMLTFRCVFDGGRLGCARCFQHLRDRGENDLARKKFEQSLRERGDRLSPTVRLPKNKSHHKLWRNMIQHPCNLILCPRFRFCFLLGLLHRTRHNPAQVVSGLQPRPGELFMVWCRTYRVRLRFPFCRRHLGSFRRQ